MIPVEQQPEPEVFEERVRRPGTAFLRRVPHPTAKQWKSCHYWQKVLPDMRKLYRGICAYSAHWISPITGSHSVDHFVSKAASPALAYEWTNYRYASLKFNSRKGTQTILDPFEIEPDSFVIDFPSLLVKPDSALFPNQKESVRNTIDVLKLNDETCVEARRAWVENYCKGEINFGHLQKKAPFIACELERQGLVERIRDVMSMR